MFFFTLTFCFFPLLFKEGIEGWFSLGGPAGAGRPPPRQRGGL